MRNHDMTDFRHTPTNSIGLQFWNVSQRWQKQVAKALQPYDLTHTQFVILAAVKWHQDQSIKPTQTDITRLTNIEKMTLSKAIRKLEATGFITRKTDNTDSRSKSVTLTTHHQDTLRSAVQAVEQVDEEFFGHLTSQQSDRLLETLLKLSDPTRP